MTERKIGAGGTPGGTGMFLGGFLLSAVGLYLFFSQVVVRGGHLSGGWLGSFIGYGPTVAVVVVPFVIGVALLFRDASSRVGWATLAVALLMLFLDILTSLHIYFKPTSLPHVLAMFVMIAGGCGLMLRSFRDTEA